MRSPLTIGQEILRRKLAELGVEVTPDEFLRIVAAVGGIPAKDPLGIRRGECACCHKKTALVCNWCVDCLITRKGVEVEP